MGEHTRNKKVKILLLVLAAILLLALCVLAWLWYDNVFTLDIRIAAEKEITVDYGGSFQPPAAEGWFSGTRFYREPVSVPVSHTGTVDTQKLGDYKLTYRAVFKRYEQIQVVTVHVVDREAPVITLVTDPDRYTLPNHPYEEEGFTATDNHDGDLTDKVQREEKDGVVTYTVTDASGNTATVKRNIHYNDPTPPVLTLKGDLKLVVQGGTVYEDPGYEATDDCDGDITDKVVVSGDLDMEKAGVYTLTYTVSDTFGNAVSAERRVTVLPKSSVPGSGKIIYLTFDDGPSGYTYRLLNILAKYDVKATFFVVDKGDPNALKRIYEEGHSIAIHSTSHDYYEIYASEEAFFNDLYNMQSIIENATGYKTTLMRFPGGSSNSVSKYNPGIMTRLTKAVVEEGFQYFDWNVDSRDAGGAKTAEEVFTNVINGVSGRRVSVVLQHDIFGYSVDAVESIIQWGLANGYTFLPLTEGGPGCHHGVNN